MAGLFALGIQGAAAFQPNEAENQPDYNQKALLGGQVGENGDGEVLNIVAHSNLLTWWVIGKPCTREMLLQKILPEGSALAGTRESPQAQGLLGQSSMEASSSQGKVLWFSGA